MTRTTAGLWCVALALAGCRTRPGSSVDRGYSVESEALDFGRVLEGTEAQLSLTVESEGRGDLDLSFSFEGPFEGETSALLPGGGQLDLPITFRAGNSPAEGAVTVTASTGSVRVALKGLGVRPLACVASAPCRVSQYDFESDRCVERERADGDACIPDNECLEQGQCRSGKCLGIPRTCEDKNPCTVDQCSSDFGCVHTERKCALLDPSKPCRVPFCDPTTPDGCKDVVAPDLTPCGPASCTSIHLCVGGTCQVLPTPDDIIECAPATPCRDKGYCRKGACDIPDAGVMSWEYAAPLPGLPGPSPVALASAGNLYLSLCGLDADGGTATPCSGGCADGGAPDAGSWCGLQSYTGNGFLRYAHVYQDGTLRRLAGAAGGRLLTCAADDTLEIRATADGRTLTSLALSFPSPGEQPVALTPQGTVWLARASDAGTALHVLTDAGLSTVFSAATQGARLVAVDQAGDVYLAQDTTLLQWQAADGGVRTRPLPATASSVELTGSGLLLNGVWVLDRDGGLVHTLSASHDGGAFSPEAHPRLFGDHRGYVFYTACEAPLSSCPPQTEVLWVRALDPQSGTTLWEVPAYTAAERQNVDDAPRLRWAQLLDAQVTTGVATLFDVQVDGGPGGAVLTGYAAGNRVIQCELPGRGLVVDAVAAGGRLLVVRERAEGLFLEAYGLGSLTSLESGWPLSQGSGGARTELP